MKIYNDFYTKTIPFELSKKFIGLDFDFCMDWYDETGEWFVSQRKGYSPAPTYAEVVDRFLNKGIFISLTPYFTFAMANHMGFAYEISYVDEDEPKLKRESWGEFASFELCMKYAIERAIEIYKGILK